MDNTQHLQGLRKRFLELSGQYQQHILSGKSFTEARELNKELNQIETEIKSLEQNAKASNENYSAKL